MKIPSWGHTRKSGYARDKEEMEEFQRLIFPYCQQNPNPIQKHSQKNEARTSTKQKTGDQEWSLLESYNKSSVNKSSVINALGPASDQREK